MRFGILTQYYPPEVGAPQARLSDLAARFAARGHEVFVLTAMPNYPQGRIYEGYGGLLKRETRAEADVVRTFIYPSLSVGMGRRMASYFSFVMSSLIPGGFFVPKLDYLMTESPPLFLGISGYLLSRWKRARWVFNVSDLWPRSAEQLGVVKEGRKLDAARRLESFCYRKAWLVTGQSESSLKDISQRFPDRPLHHLPHGVDLELFQPKAPDPVLRRDLAGDIDPDAACIAVYTGLHGIAQGLDFVLEAAAKLRDLSFLRFVLVGDGPEKQRLMSRAQEMQLGNVRFLDPVPRDEVPGLLSAADLALAPLRQSLTGAIPSKLYEAMGAGLPVVLMAEGEPAEIVEGVGAGVALPPGDVEALAAALRNLATDAGLRDRLGAAGRRAAEERYDRTAINDRFVDRLEAAL